MEKLPVERSGNSIPRHRGLAAIDGAIALIVILVVVQMWWLTASVEAYLSGHHESALPAAVVSAVIFTICLLLFLFILRVDRDVRARR